MKKLPGLHLKYDYIKIEPSDSPCRKIESEGTFQIVQLTDNSHATCGYSLTPLAAKKFLMKSNKWRSSVDNFIGEASLHKIISYSLIPYAVYPQKNLIKKAFKQQYRTPKISEFQFTLKPLGNVIDSFDLFG